MTRPAGIAGKTEASRDKEVKFAGKRQFLIRRSLEGIATTHVFAFS
jgi:hypothetical protein